MLELQHSWKWWDILKFHHIHRKNFKWSLHIKSHVQLGLLFSQQVLCCSPLIQAYTSVWRVLSFFISGFLYDISGSFYAAFLTLGALEAVAGILTLVKPTFLQNQVYLLWSSNFIRFAPILDLFLTELQKNVLTSAYYLQWMLTWD